MKALIKPAAINARPRNATPKPTPKALATVASSAQQSTWKPNISPATRKPPHWSDHQVTPITLVQRILDTKLKG